MGPCWPLVFSIFQHLLVVTSIDCVDFCIDSVENSIVPFEISIASSLCWASFWLSGVLKGISQVSLVVVLYRW
jgi:hypothetical protein